jgi:hypothetical protein
MIKNANLISYLPGILQNVREYTVIMDAENPEFQQVFDTSEVLVDDLFITTATIQGLKRYESILSVKPSDQDTVETRRLRIISRWNDRIPYTWNALKDKLDVLCGVNNYTLDLENEIYTLNFEVHLGTYGALDELFSMLQQLLPANLIFIIDNVLLQGDTEEVFLGSAMVQGYHYTLTSDINTTYSSDGITTNASVPIIGNKYEIS